MAAANCTWTMSNGQVLSVYLSADAVGASPATCLTGTATSGMPTDFKFSSDCCLVDKVNGTSTGALMEVYNVDKSRRTGKLIAGATLANTVADRPVEKVCFKGNTWYRLIMVVAQS